MKEILVFDSSTLKGHHEIYLRKFLSILIEHGFLVYLFCEDNDFIIRTLDENQKKSCKSLELHFSILEKAFCKSLVSLDWLSAKVFPLFPRSYFSSLIPLICTKNLQRQQNNELPVFFLYVDSVLPRISLWLIKLTSIFPKTWFSLYVQPLYLKNTEIESSDNYWKSIEEKSFSLQSCKSVLLLDPMHAKSFGKKFNNLASFYLPEIIDAKIEKDYSSVTAILEAANKRKIVSVIGSLLPKRNLLLFLEAVVNLDEKRFFILIVGIMPSHLYTKDELSKIERLSNKLQNNSYICTDYYIPEEEEFNALLNISDLVYLQYKDHPFSSNILAKTISMRKPVIVNPGYLMEKTVQRYNWRAIVPENPEQVVETIEDLVLNFQVNQEGYDLFLREHSEESFRVAVLGAIKAL